MESLKMHHKYLHVDSLCAKLANIVYKAGDAGVRACVQDHFEILAENRLQRPGQGDESTPPSPGGPRAGAGGSSGPAFWVLRALFDLPLIVVVFRGSQNLIDWIVNSGRYQ
jgi:hypothetical protein